MTTLNPILRISFTVWLMLFATHSAIAQMESEMIVTRLAPAIVSVSVIPLAPGEDLRTHGRVRRGAIGISATTVAVDNLKGQGVERFYSARVTAVRAGGPAQLAQVEVGDFILNVNGVPTPTAGTLLRFIHERKPDENLDLAVIRKGTRLTIKVRTEELTP
jgi:S1-C subfamily serine protease